MRVFLFRGLAIIHLILGVMYLYWRITSGFQGDALWLSILFLIAEIFTFAATIGFCLSQLAPESKPTLRSEELFDPSAEPPYVDVLIIRRWDSIETTSQTAKAALQLAYPWHRLFIYIVDLEESDSMRQVALSIPCEYISCTPSTVDPLSFILNEVTTFGEFLLILEPGQFPNPDILQTTLPYFYTRSEATPIVNSTGFVQVILKTLSHSRPDHPLQQPIPFGKTGAEAAPFLGTGAVLRRVALQSVPHIDSRHPVLLGSLMHLQGWRSFLCSSTEVTGALLPLRNRRIALLAMLEALKQNPILAPQTSQVQKFQYLWLGFWSMNGFASLIYFLIPIWFLWTGATPVPAFDQSFFLWFLPYAGAGRLAWFAAFFPTHVGSAWQAERQTGAQFFQSLQAIAQSLKHEIPYREKPSQLSLGPQALLILLCLSAIVMGSWRLAQAESINWNSFSFGVAWIVYNLTLLIIRPPGFDFKIWPWVRDR